MSRYDCRAQGCEWRPGGEDDPRGELTSHAIDSGHPLCVVCALSLSELEPQTCERCLTRAREHLAEIVELYALLPEQLGQLGSNAPNPSRSESGNHSDETPLPGGDTLVMLAPGSAGASQARAIWRGGDATHALDEHHSDVPSVAYELSRAEDDWRTTMGRPAAENEATVVGCAGYLEVHMRWAANNHPAFDEFAADLRRLRAMLRSRTGRDERPETGAPCFDCPEVHLERPWTEAGLADDYECPRCSRTYTSAEYWLAVRAEMDTRRAAS